MDLSDAAQSNDSGNKGNALGISGEKYISTENTKIIVETGQSQRGKDNNGFDLEEYGSS